MIITRFYTKRKLIKKILPHQLTGQKNILEIGIGSGLGAITLIQHDPSITVHAAYIRDMPFNSNYFDATFAILSIHNLYKPEERYDALTEITRVIRSGGQLIIIDFKCHNEYRDHLQRLRAENISTSHHYLSVLPFLKVSTAVIA